MKRSTSLMMMIVIVCGVCAISSSAAAFVAFLIWNPSQTPAPAPFMDVFEGTIVSPASSAVPPTVPPSVPPTPPKVPPPTPPKVPPPTPPKVEQPVEGLAKIFLDGHNEIRRQNNLGLFSWDPMLERLAKTNAARQVALGRYGHHAYHENAHGTGTTYPENGWVGTPTPGWSAKELAISPGHREHVLGANVSKVGCAFVPGVVRGGGPNDNYCKWEWSTTDPTNPCNQGQNICFYDAWGPKIL